MATRGSYKDVNAWPESDRLAWRRVTGPGALLRPGGEAARWEPETRYKVERAVGHFMNWAAGYNLLSTDGIAVLCIPEVVAYYVAYMFDDGLAAYTVRTRLTSLERFLAVTSPDIDRSPIKRILKNLPKSDNRESKRARLKRPSVLFDLGIRLMREASERKRVSRQAAARFRDGLIIAFLALRPIRLGELARMHLDQHLCQEDDGSLRVEFSDDETKNHAPLEFKFPESLVAQLDQYLSIYRPLLADGRYEGKALWIGVREYNQLTENGLYYAITDRTRAAFGHHINPHLFRDCAATFIAIEHPEQVRLVALILGHLDERTFERHYNQARSVDACVQHQAVIAALKAKLEASGVVAFNPGMS